MRAKKLIVVPLAFALSSSADPQGNLVVNGGFEDHWNGWDPAGSAGNIGFIKAPEGDRCAAIDGAIWQGLATTPGQFYHLSFQITGDPRQMETVELATEWGATSLTPVIWRPGLHTLEDPGWIQADFYVQATSESTVLKLRNPIPLGGDVLYDRLPFVDDVRVMAVPEPSAAILLMAGTITWLLVRRCKDREMQNR